MTEGLTRPWAFAAVVALLGTACVQELADEEGGAASARETLIAPGELRGFASRDPGGDDFVRCVPDPVRQVESLRAQGDPMGFRIEASYPPICGHAWHWQGVQRLYVGDRRHLVVSSSHAPDSGAGAHMAAVHLGSRGDDGRRLRGNRMSLAAPDWDTPVPTEDAMVADVALNPVYNHPGGLQAMGRYLFVPLERSDGAGTARVYLYDVAGLVGAASCDPATGAGCPLKRWGYVTAQSGASTVAVARLTNPGGKLRRYLMVTAGRQSDVLELHVSEPTSSIENASLFGSWGTPEATLDTTADPRLGDWGEYQNLDLVTACEDGQLYLLASHHNGRVYPEEDWIDLWELDLVPDGGVNRDGSPTYHAQIVERASRHLNSSVFSGDEMFNLDAAAGSYVDPDGRLLLYATGWNDDDHDLQIPMMEIGAQDPNDLPDTASIERCDASSLAWVDLYQHGWLAGASTRVDYDDRSRREYRDFATAADMDDDVRGARFCMPSGLRYRLFRDRHFSGGYEDLVGDGTVHERRWYGEPRWSSGCFHDGATCLVEGPTGGGGAGGGTSGGGGEGGGPTLPN